VLVVGDRGRIPPPEHPRNPGCARPGRTRNHRGTREAVLRSLSAIVAIPEALTEPADRSMVKRMLRQPRARRQHRVSVREAPTMRKQARRCVYAIGEPRSTSIAVGAGEPQIREVVSSTLRDRNDVIDRAAAVTRPECVAAVPAAGTVALDQLVDRRCSPFTASEAPRHTSASRQCETPVPGRKDRRLMTGHRSGSVTHIAHSRSPRSSTVMPSFDHMPRIAASP
jgi:hypothetical protein